ncbi:MULTISPECIES: thioesterase family protein [unclassified Treponema]|uniref:thioesterase family protein n=1 Tax=unclassified Treponema TaxID=2638727 RepID=UPI0020A3886E|nr:MULTISPECIES: thioesterase family protein [unclassified Treponema]UTC68318.1 thioesterase family protein [Treponema sp. OMZ 789]UTC71039.1 thioesterase family protein [Treponema sp. OMZ 790]UTC73780.1 thioesterase family protein [Treponema sp. OMZ 791]
MLKTGIKGKEEIIVNENHSAESLESGTLKVFGSPAMIALMEKTAWKSVQDYLEEGQGSVGTSLEIKHVSATPLGMKVYCESELTGIDGKKLIFSVKAYDETGLIGEGTHERFIVNNKKFQKKTNEKMK